MKKLRLLVLLSSMPVACASLPHISFAGSAFSDQKEISTAEAAALLMNKCGANPTDSCIGSVSNTLEQEGVSIDGLSAGDYFVKTIDSMVSLDIPKASPISLLNCTSNSIKVKTYNSDDTVLLIPYQENSIGSGTAVVLKCATKTCKIAVGKNAATKAISGYALYRSGKVTVSDLATLKNGC